MTNRQLKTIARDFASGILDGKRSAAMCAVVSLPLAGFLSAVCAVDCLTAEGDVYTDRTDGGVDVWNHVWIELPDGRVIDCTADQFNGPDRKYPRIYVGRPLDIHRKRKQAA